MITSNFCWFRQDKMDDTLIKAKENKVVVNEALFRPSEWDDYPLKRNDKYTNKVVQPDFAPFHDLSQPEVLPDGFQFISLNIRDEKVAEAVCAFLNANYVTGTDISRFQVTPSHLQWVLDVPHASFPRGEELIGDCIFGVATATDNQLIGVIASRPITYRVDGRVVCTLEVGWLCSIKERRGLRMAAVLMKELYRRAHTWGVDVGMIFTMPRQLPALYTVGPIKLLQRTLTSDNPPKPTKNIDLVRFANMRDINRMMKIYTGYCDRWRLHREYNKREFEHTFLRRGDVMTYVIRTDKGDVKDFVSLYSLMEGEHKVAYVQFISFLDDEQQKLLQLFMQNVLYIMYRNKFAAVYIPDVNGVGNTLKSKLAFTDVGRMGYMYQFNYNTITIAPEATQIGPGFI